MKKSKVLSYFIILFIGFSFTTFSQEKLCGSEEKEVELDLNTISVAKCAVEKWESSGEKKPNKTRQLAVKLSSRRRIIRKRPNREQVASVSSLTSGKVNKVNSSKASVANIVKLETEIDDSVILPFSLTSEKPSFVKCNNSNPKCFNEEMQKHIKAHFSYPKEAFKKGVEGKIVVRFNINKRGVVTNISSSASYENEVLKNEAERIIAELPRFVPAKKNNKLVNTSHGVAINFKINDKVRNSFKKEKIIKNAISFDKVEVIPVFKSCDTGASKESTLKCFNTGMVNHIQDNFSYPKLALQNNISGKVWVSFVINEKGDVKNIEMKGPKNSYILKTEAKRLVSTLPKLIPGKHNGKTVNVRYTLPVNFTLN